VKLMQLKSTAWLYLGLTLSVISLAGCQGIVSGAPVEAGSGPYQVTVSTSGLGSGTITSTPAGIDCPGTCTASFAGGTQLTLTASASNGAFTGWSGSCNGTSACNLVITTDTSVTAAFALNLQSIQHIVFMVQENRSFDQYFGALREYWRENGYADQAFDGLPQFNNPSEPLASNPGCDPAYPFTTSPSPYTPCTVDSSSPAIQSYHLITQCVENPSPSWNEAHVDWNVHTPLSSTPTMDGIVKTAANEIRSTEYVPGSNPPEDDYNGLRAMGYYDGGDLPYYYFMASNFATSDRWFSPVMTRTQPNREYLIAATSAGHVYPPGPSTPKYTTKTIFEELQDNNISWRVYVSDYALGGTLASHTELGYYAFAQQYPQNFAPSTQFITDAQNGTLPSVSEIDPGFDSGTDEHAGLDDTKPGDKIQVGAKYVASLINALMQSPSWKNTVFILTWDEFGGFYDHVPPQPMPSPDGIKPIDLKPGDICTTTTGVTCDFVFTGYRVPLIVISPFTKQHYVSHTVEDYTAILKFIETRFNLPSLTARDAAQPDMTEFFDFTNPPWMTPPTPPAQPTNMPCYMGQTP
jgi:phospholipase C